MSQRYRTCCECGKRRDDCRESVRHLDGASDWVCRQCWRALHYAAFYPGLSSPTETSRVFTGEAP